MADATPTPLTNAERMAQAWDEGYRHACQDHRGYLACSTGDHGQSRINPYRDYPPAQTTGADRG